MPSAILFYDVVVWLHVSAIVLAFGVTFAYPILVPYVTRNHPRALPAVHAAQDQIGKKLISPAATVALLAGAYLATDREYWDRPWVSVPLVLLIVIMGLGGAVMSPGERRASALAQRDVEASGHGPVQLSDEYRAVAKRLAAFGAAAAFMVLVALFFMLTKPGGY